MPPEALSTFAVQARSLMVPICCMAPRPYLTGNTHQFFWGGLMWKSAHVRSRTFFSDKEVLIAAYRAECPAPVVALSTGTEYLTSAKKLLH